MNNPVVENTTTQINKTTIEPYHFITKKISKWSNAIKDQDYKFDIYKFGNYYVNNLGYQILRGRIDVRRFFNNDAFVVAFVIIAPRIQDKEKWEKTINTDDIIISVNNKIIDNKAVKIQHAEYTLDYRPDTLDTLFNFQKTSISRKPEGPIDVYSVVLTSQQLGIKFSELNSLIMQSSDNAEIWEVKKSDNKIFNYRVSAIDDKVKIKIPERYQFDFGELNNDTLSTDKFYINTEISLKKLSHKNLNHLATSKSWLEDDVHKYKGANELEDEYFWPHFWLSDYGTQFLKNSSLPDYGIKSFDGPVWSNLTTKSNINKKIQHNLYSGSEDVVEYYYNAPTRYDYSTKTIIDDSDSDTNGLFIPYNQAGEIKTSYNWFFKNKYNNNDADLINVQILNKNLIDKPILDFVNGQISLSISDSPIEPKLLRYSLDTKQIETYIKMNPVDPSYFEKFRKIAKNTEKEAKNEEKILIPLVSVGLIGAIVAPVAVISATRKSGSKIEEAEFKNINSENVFPKLENDDIYQCIRYNGNDFWLDKSIIDKVVRYVSSNLQTNADTFDFSYKWINKYTIIFDFVVKSGVETYSHQYKIEAKM